LKKRRFTKAALVFSACLFILWWALGTGATLAWFSDTDAVRNQFEIGLLKLDVDYRNDIVTEYTPLEGATKAFNDEALYEPGYTQVVYLRIDNTGDMAFNYKMAVTVEDADIGRNAWGDDIYLPNYLRYGVVFGETEAQVQAQVKDRLAARAEAPQDWGELGTWSQVSPYTFEPNEDYHYAALIVYMPEQVGDIANYRGAIQPRVELGITVHAQQDKTPIR
jgi:predicted ribosomally synthesized peptide with SipW-like signal peptide